LSSHFKHVTSVLNVKVLYFDLNQILINYSNWLIDFTELFFSLIGDSGVFSNWANQDNLALVILTILFTFIIVIYLLNLLIGLISSMIEKNHKASYLMHKAKVLVAKKSIVYLLIYFIIDLLKKKFIFFSFSK